MVRFRLAAVTAVLCFGAVSAFGALNAYLKIEGTKTKSFNPQVASGLIPVNASLQSIVSPRDAASGLPTGKRQQKPISVTKPIDKSTPLIYKALVDNEALKEVVITFFETTPDGKVRLTRQARLTDVKIRSAKRVPRRPNSVEPPMEEVSFVFHNITWTVINRVQGVDDWKTQR